MSAALFMMFVFFAFVAAWFFVSTLPREAQLILIIVVAMVVIQLLVMLSPVSFGVSLVTVATGVSLYGMKFIKIA